MHGGGYYIGGLGTHGAFCGRLAKALGGRVLFADYRLALAVCQAALDEGLRAPDRLILFSAWLDMTLSGQSVRDNAASDSMLSMNIVSKMRAMYLGDHDPADQRASPLCHMGTNLPPTTVVYSLSEMLRDDSTRLVANLSLGGTEVTELAVDGMPHVFALLSTLPAAGRVLNAVGKEVLLF